MEVKRKHTALFPVTRRRIGQFFNSRFINWDDTVNRIIDILEGKAYDDVKSLDDLEDVRIPEHILPEYVKRHYAALEKQIRENFEQESEGK